MKEIKSKHELAVFIKQPNTEQDSRLFCCNKVTLEANHIYFWSGGALIYKIWLIKTYKSLEKALEDVDIRVGRQNG